MQEYGFPNCSLKILRLSVHEIRYAEVAAAVGEMRQ